MKTYFEQIIEACEARGVEVEEIAKAAGIASTTVWRWRRGETFPREQTARELLAKIEEM